MIKEIIYNWRAIFFMLITFFCIFAEIYVFSVGDRLAGYAFMISVIVLSSFSLATLKIPRKMVK